MADPDHQSTPAAIFFQAHPKEASILAGFTGSISKIKENLFDIQKKFSWATVVDLHSFRSSC